MASTQLAKKIYFPGANPDLVMEQPLALTPSAAVKTVIPSAPYHLQVPRVQVEVIVTG